MNRNVRLSIEQAIEEKSISRNLCFACLARLNEVITTRKIATSKQKGQRDVIASAAKKMGVSKQELSQMILTLSDEVFPTDKTITRIADMIMDAAYTINDSLFPDKWLKFKDSNQLEKDSARKPVVKKRVYVSEEFSKLCEYIEQEIFEGKLSDGLTDGMKRKLQDIETDTYTYQVILQTFIDFKREIIWALRDASGDYSKKFNYMIGAVKNKLPDEISLIEKREWAERQAEKTELHLQCFTNDEMLRRYKRKTEDYRPELEELW